MGPGYTLTIVEGNGVRAAEVNSAILFLLTVQDGIDLLGNLYYEDINKVILHEKNISRDFFDLKTGFAGEVLQKFSNYRVRLAIVGDFSGYTSKSMQDFIRESNRTGQVIFVESVAAAMMAYSK